MMAGNLIRQQSTLSVIDRLLGGLFGVGRACFLSTILVILAGFTNLPQEPEWQDAFFSTSFEALATKMQPLLPEDLSKHIQFNR